MFLTWKANLGDTVNKHFYEKYLFIAFHTLGFEDRLPLKARAVNFLGRSRDLAILYQGQTLIILS